MLSVKMLNASQWPSAVIANESKKRVDLKSWMGVPLTELPAKCVLPVELEEAWQSFSAWQSTQYPGRTMRLVPHRVGPNQHYLLTGEGHG